MSSNSNPGFQAVQRVGKWRTKWLRPRHLRRQVGNLQCSVRFGITVAALTSDEKHVSAPDHRCPLSCLMLPSLFGTRRSRPQILRRKVTTWHEINCTYIGKAYFSILHHPFSYPSERSPRCPFQAVLLPLNFFS
jgi:hypothetical protein